MPEEQAHALEEHLSHCEPCVSTVESLKVQNPLVQALQGGANLVRQADDAVRPDLLAKLRSLPSGFDGSEVNTLAPEAGTESEQGGAGSSAAAYDFLAPPQGPEEIGRLGPYRILKVLGHGGMGVVFQAEDARLQRAVALKAMLPEQAQKPGAKERFLREARAAAALEHDHIVAIFQVDEDRGIPYIAMPFLKGMSLEDWLQQRAKEGSAPIRLAQILRLAKEIARGLAAAHDRGLIHRDIKPANIWLDANAGGRVKILDFGLARLSTGEQHLTQAGVILGTPAYMAPEQARGEKVDGRADLFSLGVVLYRLATGVLPFHGPDMMSTLMALATHEPRPPSAVKEGVPAALSDLIMRLLTKDQDRRIASAKDVLKELQAIEKEASGPAPSESLLSGVKPPAMAVASVLVPAKPAAVKPPAALPSLGEAAPQPPSAPPESAASPARSDKGTPSRRSRALWPAVAAGALVLVVLAVVVIRLRTGNGELIVEVDDPNIEVLVKMNDLVVKDRTTARAFTIGAGDGEIHVFEKDGVGPFMTKKFTLNRGGTTVVNVRMEAAQAKAKTDPIPEPAPPRKIIPPTKKVEPAPGQQGDLVSDSQAPRLSGHLGPILGVKIFADGQRALSLGATGPGRENQLDIIVWGLEGGKKLGEITLPGTTTFGTRHPLAVSPDGKTLAVAPLPEGQLALFDLDKPAKPLRARDLSAKIGKVRALAFSADGKSLIAGLDSSPNLLLLSGTGQILKQESLQFASVKLTKRASLVRSLHLLPNGNKLLVNLGQELVVWDLEKFEEIRRYGSVTGFVEIVPFKDGKRFATVEADPNVCVWTLDAPKPLKSWRLPVGITSAGLHVLPGELLLQTYGGMAVHDPDIGTRVATWWAKPPVGRADVSADGRLLLAAGGVKDMNFDLHLWRLPPVVGGGSPVVPPTKERDGPEWFLHTGHSASITSVALSGDGKHVVTGSDDKTAILWEAASGRKLRTFRGHAESVLSVALSADGQHVVTGSRDMTAILWDLASGKKIQTFQGHNGAVSSVAVSADGKSIVTGSYDKTAILWDAGSGKQVQIFKGHSHFVDGVALSADGKHVVTGSYDKTAILWETESGREAQVFRGHHSFIQSVALSADGKQVLTGSHDKTAILWEAASSKMLQTFRGHSGTVRSVALSDDGKRILTGSWDKDNKDKTAILWEAGGKKLQTFDGHTSGLTSVVVSGDGKRAVTGSEDRTAILWDTADGQRLQTFQAHPAEISSVALSGDGKRMIIGSRDQAAVLWDTAGGKKLQVFRGHSGAVHSVALNLDGMYAVTGSEDKTAILWESASGKQLQMFRDHRGPIVGLALSGDGKHLITGSRDGTAKIWDTFSGGQLQTLKGHSHFVDGVALSVDGKHVVTGSRDGTAILWDLATGKQLQYFRGHTAPYSSVALSEDGKRVVTGSYDKTAILWVADGGKVLQTFRGHSGGVTSVALSKGGKYVVTGSEDMTAILWESPGGKKLQTFVGHSGGVTSSALSEDGKHLWTASSDGSTRLWNPTTGQERCRLFSFDGGTDWLVVTPEGFFDGSPEALRLVAHRDPDTLKLLDDDATRRRFHRPGLLAQVWKGEQ
jgi:WD40 repeat protein/serine/threonine protein kinase